MRVFDDDAEPEVGKYVADIVVAVDAPETDLRRPFPLMPRPELGNREGLSAGVGTTMSCTGGGGGNDVVVELSVGFPSTADPVADAVESFLIRVLLLTGSGGRFSIASRSLCLALVTETLKGDFDTSSGSLALLRSAEIGLPG